MIDSSALQDRRPRYSLLGRVFPDPQIGRGKEPLSGDLGLCEASLFGARLARVRQTGQSARPDRSSKEKRMSLPVGPFRFVALDVETANSDAASLCQIGLACVRHDAAIEVFSTLIDPRQAFAPFNVALHGIGPAKVRGAPVFPEVLALIAPLLARQIVIQHSPFDRGAIHRACRAHDLPEPGWNWADSVQIARRAWPEFSGNGGHGLAHLKQALGLDFDHHDAGEDARAAAMVVLRAEARTGLRMEELIAPTRRARPGVAVQG